jgi:hypothetical protein
VKYPGDPGISLKFQSQPNVLFFLAHPWHRGR